MKETNRQIFHLILGVFLSFSVYYGIITPLIILFLTLLGIAISIISTKKEIPIIAWFLKRFGRKNEFPGKGAIFMFIGSFIAAFLFSKDIASASIIILALGDSVGPLVGQYGKIKHPLNSRKFLEGSIAGFLSAFIGAMIFVNPFEAFFGAFFAMLIEGIDIKFGADQIDDNLTIPVVSGITIFLIRLLL